MSTFIGVTNLSDGVRIDILSIYFLRTGLYFVLHQQDIIRINAGIAVILFVKKNGSSNPYSIFLTVTYL